MLAGAIGNANNQPLKAYVVEQDVTNTQAMARKAQASASLG